MATPRSTSPGEEIERAERLLKSGAITQAEFERLKDAALAPGWGGQPTKVVYKKQGGGCGTVVLISIVVIVIAIMAGGRGGRSTTSPTATDSSGWNEAHQMMAIRSKRVLGARLKDPDSVQYKTVFSNAAVTCGTFNAKNSFGGYGEYQPFVGIGPGEPTVLIYSDKGFKREWKNRCSSLAGMSRID